jgi:hypothetical protein
MMLTVDSALIISIKKINIETEMNALKTMKQPVGITEKVSRSTMKLRFSTRWQAVACALAGAFIIPVLQSFAADPADVGTSLLSRDFADGELGMLIQNQTAGANAVVEKLEGSSVVKVTVPVDIRANGARSQLQLTADMVTVKRDLGPYFLVSFQSTKPERAGLQIRPSLIPLSAENVLTMGEAKTVASKRSESEDEGWTRSKVLFHVSEDGEWDGARLQLRILFFADNAHEDMEVFLRQVEVRQWTEEESAVVSDF